MARSDIRSMVLAAALLCPPVGAETLATGSDAAASPAAPQAKPCSAPGFRQFDFWAGRWDVADVEGKPAGRNEITLESNGCVLVEHWTSAAGNSGLSINYYDPLARTWTQQWIGLGLILHMTGGMQSDAMVLEGPLQYVATGKLTRLRGTWTALADGRVRQHFEESLDGGNTWQEWFDGYYSRMPPP